LKSNKSNHYKQYDTQKRNANALSNVHLTPYLQKLRLTLDKRSFFKITE